MMSSGADRFFDEMLETAKKAARKDVATETRQLKADLAQARKDTKVAEAGLKDVTLREKNVTKREDDVTRRENAITRKCTTAENKLRDREQDIKLAEKEIIHLLDDIDKVRDEKVVTTTTTSRKFVKRSTGRGWYGSKVASIKAEALTAIKRRAKALTKKEATDEG